jgi:hypothetical protein
MTIAGSGEKEGHQMGNDENREEDDVVVNDDVLEQAAGGGLLSGPPPAVNTTYSYGQTTYFQSYQPGTDL